MPWMRFPCGLRLWIADGDFFADHVIDYVDFRSAALGRRDNCAQASAGAALFARTFLFLLRPVYRGFLYSGARCPGFPFNFTV